MTFYRRLRGGGLVPVRTVRGSHPEFEESP